MYLLLLKTLFGVLCSERTGLVEFWVTWFQVRIEIHMHRHYQYLAL